MKKKNVEENEQVKKIISNTLSVLEPPLELSLREWADKYRVLSTEASNEAGRWDTSRTPYMIEIYEKFDKKEVRRIALQFASQMSKSEVMNNIVGRAIHIYPCPILMVQPNDTDAKDYSKERISPMIRDCKEIKNRIRKVNSKQSGNTVSHKMFPGGYIAFIGSNSPAKLAARPIKIILFDEVDRYPESVGREGDVITLGQKRLTSFGDESKCVITGTPTIRGKSVIEREREKGSMAEWELQCPNCGEYSVLDFKNLKWIEKDASTTEMVCEKCGTLAKEDRWKKNNQKTGRWVHKHKEIKSKLSYKLSALASPWRSWISIVEEWLEIQGDQEAIKSFKNTVLAETWEEKNIKTMNHLSLYKRKEKYEAEVPKGVLIITAGVDVQHDRIELEVVGWGIKKESWGLGYHKFYGNPEQNEVWDQLYDFLKTDLHFGDGTPISIFVTCIDTGYMTTKCYDFISPKESERIFGIKGQGGQVPINNGFRLTKDGKINLFSIGTNALKDSTMNKLKIKTHGEGFCHFPLDVTKNYTEEYFKTLVAEVRDPLTHKWIKINDRNEGFDMRGYAEAALEIYGYNLEEFVDLTNEQLSQFSKNGPL